MSTNNVTYSVNELAKLVGINASAVRYYIRKGLLVPSRQIGTQYVFGPGQLEQLKAIVADRNNGKSLEEIKEKGSSKALELQSIEVEPCRVIALVNQKGGVGKSTTAINLSYSLTQLGKRVLLVDNDPQANATKGLGYFQPFAQSIFNVLVESTSISEVRVKTEIEGLDLLPANLMLADAEIELITEHAREFKLWNALKNYHDDYDFIIIDCNPSLSILTINALVAATQLIIPVDSGPWALEGISRLVKFTQKIVDQQINPDLQLLGVLMTKYDHRLTIARRVVRDTAKVFGDRLFKTKIPNNIKNSE
jgi:chromosome partitioning protein